MAEEENANIEEGSTYSMTECKKTIPKKKPSKVIPPIEPPPKVDSSYSKAKKLKCKRSDKFSTCVRTVRRVPQLRYNSLLREEVLKLKERIDYDIKDAPPLKKLEIQEYPLLKFDSPTYVGTIKPARASPPPSLQIRLAPSKKLLEIKKPRSGIYINEEDIVEGSTTIPFDTYNPRLLQKEFGEKYSKFTIKLKGDQLYASELKEDPQIGDPCDVIFFNTLDPNKKLKESYLPLSEIINDLHVGFHPVVVYGTRGSKEMPDVLSSTKLALAYSTIAFCNNYLTADWTTELIDTVLNKGEALYEKSIRIRYENKDCFDILQINMIDKILFVTDLLPTCLNGKLGLNNENIFLSLQTFFTSHQTCFFTCCNTTLLIWKRCSYFYIFDPNGRIEGCIKDHKEGKSSVISVKRLEQIVHLIINLSELKLEDDFQLYNFILKQMGGKNKLFIKRTEKKKKRYTIVNKYFAIINGTESIPATTDLKTNISPIVCAFALLYSEIEPFFNWRRTILNDIVKYATDFAKKNILKKKKLELNIDCIPKVLIMGDYRAPFKIVKYITSGLINHCIDYQTSNLIIALKNFFENIKNNNCILQIDICFVLIVREQKFYYLFDPFKRGQTGEGINDETIGGCCLHFHLTFESLCKILNRHINTIMTKGNFFIHGIEIGRLIYLNPSKTDDFDKYVYLNLHYPKDCDESKMRTICPPPSKNLNKVPSKCLSLLSQTPCQRTCSEFDLYDKLHREKLMAKENEKLKISDSAISLESKAKIPEYDPLEIVNGVFEYVMCNVMQNLPIKETKKFGDDIIAKRILFKSDLGHLKDMKKKVIRGEDFDNIYMSFRKQPDKMSDDISLTTEIKIESNFINLPDGNWIIFGSKMFILRKTDEFLTASFTTLAAAAVSRKYNISTWDSSIIDLIMDIGKKLTDSIKPLDIFDKILAKRQIPCIKIGDKAYKVFVHKIKNCLAKDLPTIIPCSLTYTNLILITFKKFNCIIFKRKNFFYMFSGYPTNIVGFQTLYKGKASFLRSDQILNIIKRINYNYEILNDPKNCIIYNIDISLMSKYDKFLTATESEEQLLINKESELQAKQFQKTKEKITFLNREIIREIKRIKQFEEGSNIDENIEKSIDSLEEDVLSDNMDNYFETDDNWERNYGSNKKHFPKDDELIKKKNFKQIKKLERGYQLCKNDCFYKIQGTTALDEKYEDDGGIIRPYFYASIYALMNAIYNPPNNWNYRNIDRIIEDSYDLYNQMLDKTYNQILRINNLNAGLYTFNLNIKEFKDFYPPIENLFINIFNIKKHFILKFTNISFAIYKDDNNIIHIFDAYPSLEYLGENLNKSCENNNLAINDKNTASWIRCNNIDILLDYIQPRILTDNWRNNFQIYIIDILTYNKLPKILTKPPFEFVDDDNINNESIDGNDYLPNEKVKWLEKFNKNIPWSRLNIKNLSNQNRDCDLSKYKDFDIEIQDELYSLWGNYHPRYEIFKNVHNKQYLAVNVLACCLAKIYPIQEWSKQVIDTIVLHGTNYFVESIKTIETKNYEISLEDLNTDYELDNLNFNIHIELVTTGYLYSKKRNELNLSKALEYFFRKYEYGIIQCFQRSIAFGKADKKYFMFDCQSFGLPLFESNDGKAYVLYCTSLKLLLQCLIVTLKIPFYNIEFFIHNIDSELKISEGEEEEALGEGEEEGA